MPGLGTCQLFLWAEYRGLALGRQKYGEIWISFHEKHTKYYIISIEPCPTNFQQCNET